MINRDEKIANEIIKPKDDIITLLYNDNLALHRELSKQSRVISEAEKYQKERDKIIADNKELNNKVKELENEYKEKSTTLDLKFDNRKRELEKEFQEKNYDMEYEYKSKVRKLEKENMKMTKKNDKDKKQKDNLPFAVFICPKSNVGDIRDYKQVFTDIISDRIQEKYK